VLNKAFIVGLESNLYGEQLSTHRLPVKI